MLSVIIWTCLSVVLSVSPHPVHVAVDSIIEGHQIVVLAPDAVFRAGVAGRVQILFNVITTISKAKHQCNCEYNILTHFMIALRS